MAIERNRFAPAARDDVQAWLVRRLAKLLSVEPHTISIHAPFAQYGIDSQAAVSLAGELEDRIGRTLSATLLYEHPTIDSLAAHLTKVDGAPQNSPARKTSDEIVTFKVDAYPKRTFQGEVTQIRLNASMAHNVVTYNVIVTCDNPDGKLLPYMTANLQFAIDHRSDVLLVGNQAFRWRPEPSQVVAESRGVLEDEGQARIADELVPDDVAGSQPRDALLWVEAGGGMVRPVVVKLGLTDGTVSELSTSDLKSGDRVVIGTVREEKSGFSSAFVPRSPNRWNRTESKGS